MHSPRDLNRIFARFAGNDVPMTERVVRPLEPGAPPRRMLVPARITDPVLQQMRAAARELGLKLFVQWPGHEKPPRMKEPEQRLLARLEQGADGRWRIAPSFTIKSSWSF